MSSIIIHCARSISEIPYCIKYLTFHEIFCFHPTTHMNCIFYYDPHGNSHCLTTAIVRKQQQQQENEKMGNMRKFQQLLEEGKETKCIFTLYQKVLLLHSLYRTFCSRRCRLTFYGFFIPDVSNLHKTVFVYARRIGSFLAQVFEKKICQKTQTQ